MKHFEVVQEDHSDFVDPFSIKLRCSVVKKFLPYKGFYPAQRTVQVAQQFYNSYGTNISITGAYDMEGSNDYAIQYLLNPLFSPGILFNTIKIGVTDTKGNRLKKKENIKKRIKLIPLKRMAKPYEVAKYIYFLSSYLTFMFLFKH